MPKNKTLIDVTLPTTWNAYYYACPSRVKSTDNTIASEADVVACARKSSTQIRIFSLTSTTIDLMGKVLILSQK